MDITQQKSAGWKWLKAQVDRVQDPVLKTAMMAEFRKRAINEWGYDPETGRMPDPKAVILDDWEKELIEDIRTSEMFEIDVRLKKREYERKELEREMYFFIRNGGRIMDIPDDIRTTFIVQTYLKILDKFLPT